MIIDTSAPCRNLAVKRPKTHSQSIARPIKINFFAEFFNSRDRFREKGQTTPSQESISNGLLSSSGFRVSSQIKSCMIPCVKKFSSIIPLNFRAHSNVNIMGYNSFLEMTTERIHAIATWPYCFRNNWTLLCYLFQSIRCFAMTSLYSGDHSLFVTCGRRGWQDFGTFRQWRVGGGKESVVAYRV